MLTLIICKLFNSTLIEVYFNFGDKNDARDGFNQK